MDRDGTPITDTHRGGHGPSSGVGPPMPHRTDMTTPGVIDIAREFGLPEDWIKRNIDEDEE